MTITTPFFSHKKIFFTLGLFASALLVGLYIFQLNYLTTLAYRIAQAQEEVSQLKYENAAFQAKTFQAVSLRDLDELAQLRNFEKVDRVSYLQVSAGPVAQQ